MKLGDRVRYVGEKYYLKKQYAGELTIWEISKHDDGYACLQPDGRVTSWISFEDLELYSLASHSSRRILPRPLTIGDRVQISPTGERGCLELWHHDRKSAVVEFDDGTFSEWILVANLLQVNQEDGVILKC